MSNNLGFPDLGGSFRVRSIMAELKKVAHVMRRFVPEKWGGTESVVFNLSREFIREGLESPIFCTDMFSSPGRQPLQEVPVHRFRYVLPWLGLSSSEKDKLRLKGGSPLALGLFIHLLMEKDLSIIHTHVQHRLGGMARTVAKLRKIPLVVELHGGHFTLPQEQVDKMTEPFRGKLEWGKVFGLLFGARRILNDADAIICVGASEYEQMKAHYPSKDIFHVPNGVEIDRFEQADGAAFRAAYNFERTEKIVLCVSRIDYQKNQLGLIRAFAEFSVTHPEHHLALIGAITVTAYHQEVLAEIKQRGLSDRVQIIPGLTPDDPLLPSAYQAADLFVLPSRHEPFGIVILEAWAAGLPVVANRVGGIPGFSIDHENILLVEPDDEVALAECMGKLADDADLRNRLTASAQAAVKASYSWTTVAARIREIYEGLL